MTISSEVRKAGPFSGNDVTTAFSFSFKVFSTADVLAVSADSLGLESELTEGVDYTVSLNANQNANPGGTVTLTSPLATGYTLVLTSQVQNLQPTDLTNQGGFYPAVINAALDRATIQIQQLSEKIDRSAKLPITRTEDVDALLSDIVVLADNLSSVNTVAGSIGSVNTVAGVSADVATVAGVSAQVATVAAISTDVSTVAGVASGVPTVAASAANVDTVAGSISSVSTVSASVVSINAVAADIADVSTVAGNIANINAAVADLPALSAKVSKTGDTMTGPLSVPSGASGTQVPQAQEVVLLTGGQTVGGVKTFSSRPKVPAGATLDEVPQAQEIFGKSQSWQTVTRTSGVTYTNSTDKPIICAVTSKSSSTIGYILGAVDGVIYASSTNHIGAPSDLVMYLLVPPGSTYSFVGSNVTSVAVKEYR